MGWSCSRAAGDTLDRIIAEMEKIQIAEGIERPTSNHLPNGFWEASRVEHPDGAITGAVYSVNPANQTAHKVGSFRIDGNGQIVRFPRLPKEIREKVNAMPVDTTPLFQFQ